jgi:flavin reductase (NADH)/flavin reductase
MQAPPGSTIDSASFRAGMRQLAGGVCIITSLSAARGRAGLTATAVCSVSAEPPVLLICVHRDNRSHDVIRDAGVFAVNVLDIADQALAHRFAGSVAGDERFHGARWTRLLTGAPVLESALASFDCRIGQTLDAGTHRVLLGEVQAVRLGPAGGRPLLYAHGSYGGFAASLAVTGAEEVAGPEEEEL